MTSRTRLVVAAAAGAVAIALIAVAGYLSSRSTDLTGWTAYSPDEFASHIQHPLGAHATALWWGGAAVVVGLAGAALLVGGRDPATVLAFALMSLLAGFGAIDLHAGRPEIAGDADPWWLLAAAAVAAVGVAVTPRLGGRADP